MQEIISIEGVSGNNTIGSGTVGLRVDTSSGDDVVCVSKGSELVVQVDLGDYSTETDGEDVVITHSGSSVRIEGYKDATATEVTTASALSDFNKELPGSANFVKAQKTQSALSKLNEAAQGSVRNSVYEAQPMRFRRIIC